MAILGQGELYSPLNRVDQQYSILLDEDQRFVPMLTETWQIPLYKQVLAAKNSGLSRDQLVEYIFQNGIQDFHWVWQQIITSSLSNYEKRTFYMESAGRVQGVLHAYFPKAKRIGSGALVYIDRVAVAPWNRRNYGVKRELVGIGTVLLSYACSLSDQLGFGRCIGLHSLAQAEDFYVRIGMQDFGPDKDYENLKYFEFSSDCAKVFCGEEAA